MLPLRRLSIALLSLTVAIMPELSFAAFGGPIPDIGSGWDPYGYCLTQGINVINAAGNCRPTHDITGDGSYGGARGGSSVGTYGAGTSGGGSYGGSNVGTSGFSFPTVRRPGQTADDLLGRSPSTGWQSGGSWSFPSFGLPGGSSGNGSGGNGSSLFENGDSLAGLTGYFRSLADQFDSGSSGSQGGGGRSTGGADAQPFAGYLSSLSFGKNNGTSNGGAGADDTDGSAGLPYSDYIRSLLASRGDEKEGNAKAADSDGDGISDYDERRIGTDPHRADSDRDGVADGVEVGNPRSPFRTTRSGIIDALFPGNDSDRDGLANDMELRLGTDPNDPDTDGDGVSDGIEVGGDPLRPFITPGAQYIDALNAFNDSDGDGYNNTEEKRMGTDPLDPLDPAARLAREEAFVRTIDDQAAQERAAVRAGGLGLPKTGAERGEWFKPVELQ